MINIQLLGFECPKYLGSKLLETSGTVLPIDGVISQKILMCKWYCVAGMRGDNDGHYIKFGSWEQETTSNQHVASEILIRSAHALSLMNTTSF